MAGRVSVKVDAVDYLADQLARDRSRPVGEFLEELALLSRFSDELERRTAEAWRGVLEEAAENGRVRIAAGVAHFVRPAEEPAADCVADVSTQGSLF